MGAVAGYGVLLLLSFGGWFYLKKKKQDWKYKTYLLLAAVTGGVCLVIAILEQLAGAGAEGMVRIPRQEAGKGAIEMPLLLEAEELNGPLEYLVTVEEQLLTAQEAEQVFGEAGRELEQEILGENTSLEEITGTLHVPKKLMDGLVEVSCTFEPYGLVEPDGRILWENMKTDTEIIRVEAQMSCQEREASHEFYLRLTPLPLEGKEALLKEVRDGLAEENKGQGQEYLSLPQEIGGTGLTWHEPAAADHEKVLLLGFIAMVALYVYGREKQERAEKAWNRQLTLDYPDIVSQLSLLAGAGMTVSAAWARLASEYRDKREEGKIMLRPGYEEMLKTWYQIQDGTGERKAYENFGQRCGQAQYRKFAALLMQNVRKGTRGLQQFLDYEAEEAFLQRKAYAKQLGEEAGTKLLLPMALMLLLVFAILMLPAMMSLGL